MNMHMPMMEMYFHFRIEEPVLFKEWTPLNQTAYVFTCLGVFLIAFSLEIIKYGRSKLVEKKVVEADCCCSNIDGTWDIPETRPLSIKRSLAPFDRESIIAKNHILSSFILYIQLFVDYSLMLVAMTYNYPIFLSLLAGHTVGYFFVGPLISIEESEKLGGCCS